VDDEDALVGILASQLTEQFGYVTRVLHDGREAIELFESGETPPSLVITDYDMPEVNGLELLQWIMDRKIEIPVIVLTGAGSENVAAQSLRLGAYDFLRKEHLDLQRLGVTIQSVLERRRLRAMEEVEKGRSAEAVRNQEATDQVHAILTGIQPLLMDSLASLHSGLDLLRQRTSKLPASEQASCDEVIRRLHTEVATLDGTMKTLLELYSYVSSHYSHLERIQQLLRSVDPSKRPQA
jgi:CheY-like chemotaxis protein